MHANFEPKLELLDEIGDSEWTKIAFWIDNFFEYLVSNHYLCLWGEIPQSMQNMRSLNSHGVVCQTAKHTSQELAIAVNI